MNINSIKNTIIKLNNDYICQNINQQNHLENLENLPAITSSAITSCNTDITLSDLKSMLNSIELHKSLFTNTKFDIPFLFQYIFQFGLENVLHLFKKNQDDFIYEKDPRIILRRNKDSDVLFLIPIKDEKPSTHVEKIEFKNQTWTMDIWTPAKSRISFLVITGSERFHIYACRLTLSDGTIIMPLRGGTIEPRSALPLGNCSVYLKGLNLEIICKNSFPYFENFGKFYWHGASLKVFDPGIVDAFRQECMNINKNNNLNLIEEVDDLFTKSKKRKYNYIAGYEHLHDYKNKIHIKRTGIRVDNDRLIKKNFSLSCTEFKTAPSPTALILQRNFVLEGISMNYYSLNSLPKTNEHCTFVLLSSAEKIYLPEDKEGKVIVVGTKALLNNKPVQHFISSSYDLLIIDSFRDLTPSLLHSLNVLKQGLLEFSKKCSLKQILVIEDNLENCFITRNAKSTIEDWSHFYEYLKKNIIEQKLTKLGFNSYTKNLIKSPPDSSEFKMDEEKIESKNYMLNLEEIYSKNLTISHLFPPQADLWGEEIFFELALRANSLKTASAAHQTVYFEQKILHKKIKYAQLEADAWLPLSPNPEMPSFHCSIYSEIKEIVLKSMEHWKNYQQRANQQNIPVLQQNELNKLTNPSNAVDLNGLKSIKASDKIIKFKKPVSVSINLNLIKFDPICGIESVINNIINQDFSKFPLKNPETDRFRDCQLEAFKALQKHLRSGRSLGYINMATGSGKTRMFFALAALALRTPEYKKNIIIVSPRINLLHGLREEYIKFEKKLTNSLINNTIIIATDGLGSTNGLSVLENEKWKKGGNIGFCCGNTLREIPEQLNHASLVIVDEFHLVGREVLDYCQHYSTLGAHVIGFSATPAKARMKMGEKIFTYTSEQAAEDKVITPWMIHRLPASSENKMMLDFLEKLPDFIETHYHPHGGTLKENRGLIFVPKKLKVEGKKLKGKEIAEYLKNIFDIHNAKNPNQQIFVHTIHSDKTDSVGIAKTYKTTKGPAILIAIDMLKVGFDSEVDYVLFLRSNAKNSTLIQVRGRALRIHPPTANHNLPKIGYMLVPQDAKLPKNFDYSKRDQLQLHPNYLSQHPLIVNERRQPEIFDSLKNSQHKKFLNSTRNSLKHSNPPGSEMDLSVDEELNQPAAPVIKKAALKELVALQEKKLKRLTIPETNHANHEVLQKNLNEIKEMPPVSSIELIQFDYSLGLQHLVEAVIRQDFQQFPFSDKEANQFRSCQLNGFEALKNSWATTDSNLVYLNMATGTGKTRMFLALTSLALSLSQYKGNILVVSPRINLLHGLRTEYKKFQNNLLKPINNSIIIATANQGCFNASTVLNNKDWHTGGLVGFCCSASLRENPQLLNHAPFVIVDEFHLVGKEVIKYCQYYSSLGAKIVGFSATPDSAKELMGKEIYKYDSLTAAKDKVICPWLIKRLDVSSESDKMLTFLKRLPEFLNTHRHPHGGKLSENRGVIYVPKDIILQNKKMKGTECANMIIEIFKKYNENKENHFIDVQCVHSKNTKTIAIIKEFKQKQGPALLVAVEMLKEGFDSELDYGLFLRKKAKESTHIQVRGRLLRVHAPTAKSTLPKIGYLLIPSDAQVPHDFEYSEAHALALDPHYVQQCNEKGNFIEILHRDIPSIEPIIQNKENDVLKNLNNNERLLSHLTGIYTSRSRNEKQIYRLIPISANGNTKQQWARAVSLGLRYPAEEKSSFETCLKESDIEEKIENLFKDPLNLLKTDSEVSGLFKEGKLQVLWYQFTNSTWGSPLMFLEKNELENPVHKVQLLSHKNKLYAMQHVKTESLISN